MSEVSSFAFHRSYHNTLKALPDDQRLALSDAIGAYAFEGQQPMFSDPMLDLVWGLIAPNISASVRKSAANSKRKSTRDSKPSPHGNPRENPCGKRDGRTSGKPHGRPESIGEERIGEGVVENPSSNEEEGSQTTAPSGTGAAAAKAAPPLPAGWERTGVICSHANCAVLQVRDDQGGLWCPECDAGLLETMGVRR